MSIDVLQTSQYNIINNEIDVIQETGIPGPPGSPGPYYIPSISEDGILSWTNTGDLSNPPSFNIKGKGGYREVKTISDRDNIPISSRSKGMLVYVSETNTVYSLIDETTNEYEEFITNTLKRYNSFADLPSVGKPNVIYLITDTYDMYVWNPDKIQFIQLNSNIQNIQIDKIICGDSNV